MSHFTVAVFTDGTKTVDELLAPFDENISVEPYIYKTKAQIIEDAKEKKERYLKDLPSNVPNWMKAYIDAETDEELYQAEFDEDEQYDEEGNELSTYNPNSKWDWYSIGGRWKGILKAKAGEVGEISLIYPIETPKGRYSSAKVKDIDFTPDKAKYEKRIRFWEVSVEGSPLRPGENKRDFDGFYNKEWYQARYKNKEEYAERECAFTTFAVLMPDGTWYEKGQMGWWGFSGESHEEAYNWDKHYKENFIDKADPEWTLTIVDCHI